MVGVCVPTVASWVWLKELVSEGGPQSKDLGWGSPGSLLSALSQSPSSPLPSLTFLEAAPPLPLPLPALPRDPEANTSS